MKYAPYVMPILRDKNNFYVPMRFSYSPIQKMAGYAAHANDNERSHDASMDS